MKILLGVLFTLFAFTVSAGDTPKGKPFVYIQGEIVAVQDDIADLKTEVAALITGVDTLEGQVSVLEGELALLQDDVALNANKIAIIEAELLTLNANLLLKQNIVNGVCPTGQAMVSVNIGINDGSIVCAPSSGGITDLHMVIVDRFTFGSAASAVEGFADCPYGYDVTGGGGTWASGLSKSAPGSRTRWTLKGLPGTTMGFGVMVTSAMCLQGS